MTTLRPITLSDQDIICQHRSEMFREAGRAEAELAGMREPFRRWLQTRLAEGRYFGFMAELSGKIIGGVGLMEIDWPPHPVHPASDRRGYVLNVFVEPAYRGQGIGKLLMQAADQEFLRRGISYAILHTTRAGQPLYEGLGWAKTSEMAKIVTT